MLLHLAHFVNYTKMADEAMEIDGALNAPTSNQTLYYAQPESFTTQGT